MTNKITIEEATKKFKNTTVFNNINLELESGKSYGFIGYNGCGKSVFLKTICGFSLLSSGRITLNGKIIGKDIDFIENTGVIIETPSFIDHLSGFENLLLISQIQGLIDKAKIEDTMKMLGIYEDRNKAVKKYSLGMKQKLRIAQAIMEDPEILILDEPTNGLDKKSVLLLREFFVNFVKAGGLLIMTSHNKDDIEICCETIYEFDNGNLSLYKSDCGEIEHAKTIN